MSSERTFEVQRRQRIGYAEALALQRRRWAALASGAAVPGLLLCVEHTPLVTLGRAGRAEHLLVRRHELARRGIAFHRSQRGGDITYHGPGQLTLYPVFPLAWWERDLHKYMRRLEALGLHYLREHGIQGGREPGLTGIWVGPEKIGAIGIAVSRWITYHGLSLNVAPDLSHFQTILACGIRDRSVTSLTRITGETYDMAVEAERLLAAFFAVFTGAHRLPQPAEAHHG